ncbi:HigA family addiction module antitoxin [Pseudomonas sp. LS1212]|uniref:HigA family addiction module antitoxin n=1 Tax=Pseudomonas sp. LS1212 TaxID=2972478 RepID=UPI00215BD276|nr:HigA family addiction module antitoxin [Pseudomonas sp. LS1212]UVJ42859.1 HigA family addiction module antitoxin [Pseudomonas sp. LS1212]
MPMYNPPHPGEALREDVLPALDLTVSELAGHLGYSRGHLSAVLNGRAAISADMAYRFELAGLGKARMWLAQQGAYYLWQFEHGEQSVAGRSGGVILE